MAETPFFFQGQVGELFGVWHEPQGDARGVTLVFCHPFMEEKLWAHRVFVHMARTLAEAGFGVLRFDMRGNGDSDGRFAEATLDNYLSDIDTARAEAAKRAPDSKIGLLGLRLGAGLAAQAAARFGFDGPLVLWEPVTSGDRYSQEILRSNLTTQMAVHGKVTTTREQLVEQMQAGEPVDVEGYEFSWTVFEALKNANFAEAAGEPYGQPTLVVQVVKNEKQPLRKDLEAMAEAVAKDAKVDKAEEEPFWREIKTYYGQAPRLEALTLDWLREVTA